MVNIGVFIIPGIIGFVVLFGIIRGVPIFDTFIKGAKEGINSTISILPPLLGLIVAITMFKESGALDIFTKAIEPLIIRIGLPREVIPLMMLRPISGSGAIAITDSIFKDFSPDSFVGKLASVMMGSTETTFYAIAIYFGSIGIKNTRHTVPAALIADITSYITALSLVKLFN